MYFLSEWLKDQRVGGTTFVVSWLLCSRYCLDIIQQSFPSLMLLKCFGKNSPDYQRLGRSCFCQDPSLFIYICDVKDLKQEFLWDYHRSPVGLTILFYQKMMPRFPQECVNHFTKLTLFHLLALILRLPVICYWCLVLYWLPVYISFNRWLVIIANMTRLVAPAVKLNHFPDEHRRYFRFG